MAGPDPHGRCIDLADEARVPRERRLVGEARNLIDNDPLSRSIGGCRSPVICEWPLKLTWACCQQGRAKALEQATLFLIERRTPGDRHNVRADDALEPHTYRRRYRKYHTSCP